MPGSIQSWGRVSGKPSGSSGLRKVTRCPENALKPDSALLCPGGEGEDRPLSREPPTGPSLVREALTLIRSGLRWHLLRRLQVLLQQGLLGPLSEGPRLGRWYSFSLE